MIRFPQTPDRVFVDILHAAIEHMIATLRGDRFDPAGFAMRYPLSARVFSPELAHTILRRLLRASRSDSLYEITDYHWLLLYESLRRFCLVFNDRDGEVGALGAEYGLRTLDFAELIDLWFWDQDFLLTEEEMDKLDPETQDDLGVRTEAIRLVQGLAPRRHELSIRRAVAAPQETAPADPFPYYRAGSTTYPDFLKQVNVD